MNCINEKDNLNLLDMDKSVNPYVYLVDNAQNMMLILKRVVGVNYFCRLTTIIFAGSPLSFFGRSCCRDCVAGLLRCGSWAH
jgi:hypothetical protein